MAGKFQEYAMVVSQESIGDGIFDLVLKTKEIAAAAVAGQFVSVYSESGTKLLPRPISLCGIDKENNTIRLVYRVTGKDTGTDEFSKLQKGDRLRILGPLGNGFTVEQNKAAILVGGGIGVPPMLQLAKDIKNKSAKGLEKDKEAPKMTIVMGYRDAKTFLLEEFQEQAQTLVATEDGSVGTKGNVLDAIREGKIQADVIYACGPMPMLRALKEYAQEQHMDCYVSMEERMACGIGACLACVCNSKEKDAHSNVNNKRICKEGPVFHAQEVEL